MIPQDKSSHKDFSLSLWDVCPLRIEGQGEVCGADTLVCGDYRLYSVKPSARSLHSKK